jgi:hypothetical protein
VDVESVAGGRKNFRQSVDVLSFAAALRSDTARDCVLLVHVSKGTDANAVTYQ